MVVEKPWYAAVVVEGEMVVLDMLELVHSQHKDKLVMVEVAEDTLVVVEEPGACQDMVEVAEDTTVVEAMVEEAMVEVLEEPGDTAVVVDMSELAHSLPLG